MAACIYNIAFQAFKVTNQGTLSVNFEVRLIDVTLRLEQLSL